MENNNFSQLYCWKCLSRLFLCVFVMGSVTTGYNLDLTTPVIRQGTRNTYFGYSVAIHSEGEEDMMIVGAPRGDSNVTGITEGGAVYRCPLVPHDYQGECQLIVLVHSATVKVETKVTACVARPADVYCSSTHTDCTRNTRLCTSREEYIFNTCFEDKPNVPSSVNRSHQWLGATVKSSGGTGEVLSCSPRRKKAFHDDYFLEPTGGCIVSSNNFTRTNRLDPCRPISVVTQVGHNKETHCQAGFGADMLEDGNFVLGGPGRSRGTGSIYFRRQGNWRNSINTFNLENDAYSGYSVAQGTQGLDVVTGAPRGGRLMGKVYIFKFKHDSVRKKQQLTGQQFGSYFGHCVAIMDLNNDGRDDLIVGAPNYWNKETHQINVGQVHVYYQTVQGNLDEDHKSIITGQETNGRFGFTVAPLGDVNDDGFNDLAVSAPYDGDGAVYIFNGRRETIHTSASQVLRPSDFPTSTVMKRFGFALSGNKDADKNSFPDLLIGAYESDAVILVRTRPIIRPEISVSFSEDVVHLSRLNSSTSSNGFSFEMCFSYSVRGTMDQHSFRILLGLDADKSTPRALFDTQNTPSKWELTVNLTKQQVYCRNWTAVMRHLNQIQDKQSPIPVRVSVSLIEDEGFLPAGKVTPYLETPNQYWEEQISVFFKCINNGTCTPDLTLKVESSTDSMYMGDSDEVSMNITVTNSADEAFGAKLYVYIPESFELSSFKSIRAESLITCELLAPMETVVACNIGNPLPSMMTTKFTLSFDVHDVPGHTETLFVNLTTNSTTMEEASTLMDNNQTVTIRLIPKVEVEMGGFSNVKRLVYKERENDDGDYSHEQEVGAEIIHSYWVKNKGPAVIGDATLTVSWPMRTVGNEYLLYLADLKITGDGECYVDPENLNPDSLQLNYYPYDSYVSHQKDFNGSETEYSEILTRRRRDTGLGDALNEPLFSPMEHPLNENPYDANCYEGYAGCVNIVCNITNFSKNSGNVVLTIRSRLYTKTVQNPESRPWNIVSSASFTINRLPYVAQPDDLSSKSQTLSLWVMPKTRNLINSVPLWAIILSVALGNLLMISIIFCLWKVGFFKRKRVRLVDGFLDEDEVEKNGKGGMEIVHVSHDCQVNRVE